MYSQKLFAGLNHITITSVDYADYKDPSGQPYINDTREHKKLVVCYKKIAWASPQVKIVLIYFIMKQLQINK